MLFAYSARRTPIIWYQSMETESPVVGKRIETRVEELEDQIRAVLGEYSMVEGETFNLPLALIR